MLDQQVQCQILAYLKKLACKDDLRLSEGIASCLEVTIAGSWGNVGDRIQEVKWYDTSGANPELYNITYFNRNSQQFVSGVTGSNVIPCIDDLPAVVSVSNFPDVFAVTTPTSDTAVITEVPSSDTSVVLKVANTNRRGLTIANGSTANLRIALSAVSSANSYTVLLGENDYYEVPFGYTGIVSGIWESATGNAFVTELT